MPFSAAGRHDPHRATLTSGGPSSLQRPLISNGTGPQGKKLRKAPELTDGGLAGLIVGVPPGVTSRSTQ